MKQQKTKRIARIASGIAIIIAMITIVSIFLETQKKQIAYQKDPEIRRMLNYDQVQKGDEAVSNTPYVQFDAFFLRDLDGDGYAEQVRGTCREISKSDTLYMNINVLTNGTLENGEISINGQNVKLTTALVEDNVIKQNYISDNTTSISLKNMQNGTQKLMYGTINPSDFGNDTTKYSKVNSITLTGTHVADDGTQTTISKTVNFNVDWYGTSNCMIYDYSRTQSNENIIDEAKENINLSFYITTEETKRNNEQLILKQAYLEGIIPQLNGYKPTKVEVTSSNVTFNYEEETGKFVVTRDATINSSGIVTKSISDYNTFTFKVSYPIAAYEVCDENTVAINIPIKAYYEGYNNTNEEFENPIRSNETQRTINLLWRKPEGSVARFDVTIGNYRSHDGQYVMSKIEPLKIYNGTAEETEDTYWVRWYAFTGNEFESQAIQMKETDISHTDRFQDNSSNYYDMASYLTNIGIYFSNVNNILGEEGYINVYNDETGELIHTFTKDDWNNYSSNNPYQYETSVKHIRIETSKAQKDSGLYIYHQKKIDDKILIKNFTKEQFDELAKVYTYLTGSIKKAEDITFTKINDDSACAVYEEPISVANLTIMPDTIGTQKTERNIKLIFQRILSYYNMQKWTNGRFLLELPAEILDLEINHISVSNTNVRVLGYEITEKNGKKYLKIETENKTEESYTITVDTNLTADPRVVTQTKTINLYAYNEYCDNYKNKIQDIYDVDGDGNKEEQVNLGTDSLTLVAPSSLLTNQQAIEYNDQGDTAVAPQIATIDKTEANTAKVNVSITNNYSGRISEVQILGKIPFKGNTFSINGTDLGSTYNTEMTATGIAIPTSLQGIATVYYSEKENPNKDLTDSTNGWTQTPDFSKVKSYLIDLGEYTLALKESLAFQYEIKVPTTVQYNDISYSTHAVYFCLDTVEGKFKTQTETTKLGFRIERKYHLTLQKTKEDTSVPVQGATFTIQEEGEEESRMGTSDRTGNIRIENLFVDKTYTLKEIRTPGSYEKNSMEVKFKVVVENDQLVLNILSGEEQLKASSITQASDTLKGIVNFKVENTPKYKVVITKKDQKTKEVLAGIKYKLEGTGLGNGIIVTTNKSGILTLTGLSHDVEYTLTEIEANGYYVNEIPIHFKVVKENGNLAFKVISGSFTSNSEVVTGTDVTGIEAQDTVTAELTDEKIPTFSISLKKYAQGENTVLKNAQYKITGEGIKESGETYSTDENGVLTISGLYEYVEGKNITGEYTLEEITPPEGYALDSTQLKFKAQRNTEGNLEISIISGGEIIRTVENNQDITITNSENENALITIGVEDEPLFKITKIDGTTKAVLPNTKFVLYEIDNNLNTIGYAKDINGNIVGTMQESNGEGSLSFTSEGESNMIWTKREDGTWESGGKSINSAVSSMISNSFLIEKNGTISFDWAVSSESVSYDYVYYTITNTKTGATIGGTSNKIGGNSSVTDYNKLTFNNVLVELSAGTYTIQFTYRKDRSGNNGLDAGFIKNVKVNGMNTAIPVVTTNKKGEISYGLKSGLYKAVEIEAVEGYELPEEAERTYYFGIGEAKAQETRFGVSYTKTIAGSKWNKIEP